MLWLSSVILLALWLLGLITGKTLGGFIHVLLVVAIVVLVVRIIQGQKPAPPRTAPSHLGFVYQGITFKSKSNRSHPRRRTGE
jgi:predicted membrane metal-binding protein